MFSDPHEAQFAVLMNSLERVGILTRIEPSDRWPRYELAMSPAWWDGRS